MARFDEIREQLENLMDELEQIKDKGMIIWNDAVDDDIFEEGFDAILDLCDWEDGAIVTAITKITNSIRKAL